MGLGITRNYQARVASKAGTQICQILTLHDKDKSLGIPRYVVANRYSTTKQSHHSILTHFENNKKIFLGLKYEKTREK